MNNSIIYKEDCYYQTFLDNEFENTNFIKSLIKEQDSDPNTVVTIIHHTDLDGIIAAQLTKEYCHNVLAIYNVKLIAYNYEKDIDFRYKILPNSNFVFVVDLSPTLKTLFDIMSILDRKVMWIDHHIGSIRTLIENREYAEYDRIIENFDIFVNTNGCGAMNCYNLMKNSTCTNGINFGSIFNERTIYLTDVYDRWLSIDDKYWADCLNKYMYTSEQLYVDSKEVHMIIHNLDKAYLSEALTKGNTYLQLEKQLNAFKYNDFHEELILHTPDGKDYKACVMWGPGNSQLFGNHINDFDVVIRAIYNKEKDEYYFSFYTVKEDVDCCAIAKQYQGSGHRAAAGCQTSYNILNKKWKVDN